MVAALREGRLDPEDLIDETGNVPADVLYSGFFMLAPTTIVAQRATLLENLWNDEFVRGFQAMAQWTRDQVPFPGAVFREVVELFVRRQRADGRVAAASAGARSTSRRPTATCSTRWPRRTRSCRERRPSRPARSSAGRSAAHELLLPGGHVTFGTGRSAFRHTLPSLADWIAAHSDELPRKGIVMEIRQLAGRGPRRRRALRGARPRGGPDVLQGGRRGPGRARRVDAPGHGSGRRRRGRRGHRLRGRRAAARLVEPRRRGPRHRRSRPARAAGSGARSHGAPSSRRSSSSCARWSSRSSPTRSRRSRCSGRSASIPRRC